MLFIKQILPLVVSIYVEFSAEVQNFSSGNFSTGDFYYTHATFIPQVIPDSFIIVSLTGCKFLVSIRAIIRARNVSSIKHYSNTNI